MVPVQRKARQLHPGRRGYLYIHETKDPNVLICEFETTRIEPSTGEEYPMPYVHEVHFRDGEISLLRDYAAHGTAVGPARCWRRWAGATDRTGGAHRAARAGRPFSRT